MAGDVVPVRYLASLLPVRAVPAATGLSVDVTVLAGEFGVLEACLDGAVPAGRGNLGGGCHRMTASGRQRFRA